MTILGTRIVSMHLVIIPYERAKVMHTYSPLTRGLDLNQFFVMFHPYQKGKQNGCCKNDLQERIEFLARSCKILQDLVRLGGSW